MSDTTQTNQQHDGHAVADTSALTAGKPDYDSIVRELKTVYDPEIPVDIWELGLIYSIDIKDDGSVDVEMTLTAPGCPVAGQIVEQVQMATERVPEVKGARVELTWEPPWTPDRLSEEARLTLDMF